MSSHAQQPAKSNLPDGKDTLWTRKLQRFKANIQNSDPKTSHLFSSLLSTARDGENEAAMVGMLLTENGLPRTFSRTWPCKRGSPLAPTMHPHLDIVLYAESDWEVEKITEIAKQTIDIYIESSRQPEFEYDWHVMSALAMPDHDDASWFIYWARNAMHAFVKPDVGEDVFRLGDRPGFEYIGTWDEFAKRVEAGDRWPGSVWPTIAVDRAPGDSHIPEDIRSVLRTASGRDGSTGGSA